MRGISVLLLIMALIVLPLIALLYYIGVAVCVAAIVCAIVYGCYCLFLFVYFLSRKFSRLKVSIKENIQDCNELNLHIENLKHSYDKYYDSIASALNFKKLQKYTSNVHQIQETAQNSLTSQAI